MANIIKLDTASKRYAFALYSLAEKNDKIEEIYSEFSKVVEVFKSIPEWISFTENPAIEHKKRAESFLKGVSTFGMIKELEDFFKVLVSRNRTIFVKDIFKEFVKIYNAKKNIEVLEISSAVKLAKEEKSQIENFIKGIKNSVKEVEFIETQDQSLISGFKFMFESKLYDTSTFNKLEKMKKGLQI